MKTLWGVNALNHDASITVMRGDDILFAGHAERYSRVKNDSRLNQSLVNDALQFGQPDEVIWLERPLAKKWRYLKAGQYNKLLEESPKTHMRSVGITAPITYSSHHLSHAAAGYFTSGFDDAVVIVVDAIGELDAISMWKGQGQNLTKVFSIQYPHSLGLLYSAFTDLLGLKPNEEEYILMGMAAYGEPMFIPNILTDFIHNINPTEFRLKKNVHRGINELWWKHFAKENPYDIAASIQAITESYLLSFVEHARKTICSNNLVFMGGCALNCVANEKIAEANIFDNIWIMPNPGDAGSSLGAILAKTKKQANWKHAFLGYNIDRPINPVEVVDAILQDKIIAIANGRAEFGPRALGNRSLIADPRGSEIKDKVNDIKHRQRFRPFAPVILADHVHDYFELPVSDSPYMQFTAKCKFPEQFPAICHVDNSSRVQTVTEADNPVFHTILTEWYKRTGCPMLLNTSLNIKGEPLVNTWEDAVRFQEKHKVRIF